MTRLSVVATLLALTAVAPSARGADYGAVEGVRWLDCYDGDTCTFTIPHWPPIIGDRITVRLRGIDAPERRGQCAAERRRGRQAREAVIALLQNAKRIVLGELGRDKYFRVLATIEADGQNVGAHLVARGLARPYDGRTKTGWCGPRSGRQDTTRSP